MFGFGKDNKDRLKENMEDIKDAINRGSGAEDHPLAGLEGSGVSDDGEELNPPEPEFPETSPEEEFENHSGPGSGPETAEQGFRDETGSSGVDSRDREVEREEPAASGEGSLDVDIPSPAETREIDVPEIEKGPLFIRRQKFEKAREMITEMLYLSREIEDVVAELETGLERDSRTESEIRQLLDEFEDDRAEVGEIVSPAED